VSGDKLKETLMKLCIGRFALAREAGDSLFITVTCGVYAIARSARLDFILVANLGFRCAPPRLYAFARPAG